MSNIPGEGKDTQELEAKFYSAMTNLAVVAHNLKEAGVGNETLNSIFQQSVEILSTAGEAIFRDGAPPMSDTGHIREQRTP